MEEYKYYFIVKNNKAIGIKESAFEINTIINKKFVEFTQEQVNFYKQHPNATIYEIQNCTIIVPPEPSLEEVKETKIMELLNYDDSENVNLFYYNNIPLWLDKATRVGLVNSCTSLEVAGGQTINIWYNDIYFTLSVSECKRLLAALEVYAIECYNVTAQHKVNIENLTTKEAVQNYDFTVGYPEKLHLGNE